MPTPAPRQQRQVEPQAPHLAKHKLRPPAPSLTDGERWTRAELAQLRAGGWGPRAVDAFLTAAFLRAGSTRRHRPALARQEAIWIAAGGAAWLAAVRVAPASSFASAGRRRGLLWWAACGAMLDWHLGMLETPDGRLVGLGPADALTLGRAWLIPALAERADPALLLLGGLTDVADGRVARATRCTRFGRDLEGLVDVCFVAAGLRGATRVGGLSPIPRRIEGGRLLAGILYAASAYLVTGRAPDTFVRRSGRAGAPMRLAALIAAGAGRRALADRLILGASGIGVAGLLRRPRARGADLRRVAAR